MKSAIIRAGSITTQERFSVIASTPPAVGVITIVPFAVASGAVIVKVSCPPAAIVLLAAAEYPPVVAMFTVTSSVPGFFKVIFFVALAAILPNATVAPLIYPSTAKPGPVKGS